MTILVTGGAGYIGSHTCLELISSGYDVCVLDDLSNSSKASLDRVEQITGKSINFVHGSIGNLDLLNSIFFENNIEAVIHFAGFKAVGESVKNPLKYFDNNVCGTIKLLERMDEHRIRNILFSSSATVYGIPESVPLREYNKLSVTNPYGRTKLMIEEILQDLKQSNFDWNIGKLRYFNPVGAHESGLIGEDPQGTPSNLMPFITQVAVGKLDKLQIYGCSYNTADGTGVRDYIHVVDLAKGHVAALKKILDKHSFTVNLGTGNGYSVLQIVKTFEQVNGITIPYDIVAQRTGDVAECYADPGLAKRILRWQAEKSLEEMCTDHWRWQKMNPNGYS
jgi:UDP-glucose 4-epimerase